MSFRTWAAPVVDASTPWLYLTLRRAPIATVTAVLVALLFFLVPQSREVLAGLGEAPVKSLKDLDADHEQGINLFALVSFLASAFALGLATWYSARLLVTVEADRAQLPALQAWPAPQRMHFAARWLPRGLGVFVMGAAIGALIYASATPTISQGSAIVLALLAIGGPLLAAAGALRGRRWPIVLGVLAWGGAAIWLFRIVKFTLAFNDVAAAVVPAALLLFLAQRRTWLPRLMAGAGDGGGTRPFEESYRALLTVVAFSVASLLLLALLDAATVRRIGSAAAVMWFLAAAQLLFTAIHIGLRHVADNVPGLTTALLLLFAIGVSQIGHESLGAESLQAPDAGHRTQSARTEPADQDRPLVVNAFGGGLRAASFTAQVLASADDASCGRFGRQVSAFSGVSGGSLGVATYLVARQAYVANGGWGDQCQPNAKATPLTDIVVRALVQDHLSPAVARMLAIDAPHVWWTPQRGQALLDSWHHALIDALGHAVQAPHRRGFELPLKELTGGMNPAPAVYFNATDADSGDIRWFSNAADGATGSPFSGTRTTEPLSISIGQAVLHSARFPVVSPAGGLQLPGKPDTRRLVDGGYADNSGITTLLAVLPSSIDVGIHRMRLINLNGNPPDEAEDGSSPPILTSLLALLRARSAHADRAVRQFTQRIGAENVSTLSLDLTKATFDPNKGDPADQLRRARSAPLGWYMSYNAAQVMALSVAASAKELCDTLSGQGECAVQAPKQAPGAMPAPKQTTEGVQAPKQAPAAAPVPAQPPSPVAPT